VQITSEDRANGVIRGRRGRIDVSANVRTQADGSVRVQFNTAGATAQDPTLIDRISRAYDQRMGR
jgi:GH25 family lysozyme M1 (1,4-beta-N-acetylmuramidase)